MQNINHGSIHINTLVKISDLDYTVIQQCEAPNKYDQYVATQSRNYIKLGQPVQKTSYSQHFLNCHLTDVICLKSLPHKLPQNCL